MPAKEVYAPTFAAVDLIFYPEGGPSIGRVMMMQLPRYPIMLKAELLGLIPDSKYELQVNNWGTDRNACALIGNKYNPLLDPSEIPVPVWTGWNYALPPSDYYGEIPPFMTDGDGNAVVDH